MNSKTKKIIAVGGTIFALWILIAWIKKRKASKAITTETPTTKSLASTTTAKSTAKTATFKKVTSIDRPERKGAATLNSVAGLAVKTGDTVKIVSPVYSGSFKVIFVGDASSGKSDVNGTAPVQHLVIDVPFKETSTGTISK